MHGKTQNLVQVNRQALQSLATKPAYNEPCDSLRKPLSALQLTKGTERLMATLLPTLTAFHPTFASQYCGSDEQTQAMMAQYAECLLDEHVDAQGLQRGLMALKRRAATERFAPNPAEFALMCKPTPADLGIPEFQTVYLQIVERNGARAGEAFEFSHPIIRLISQRKGALIRELTGLEFERTIRAEYDHWTKRIQSGEQLPEPQLAIGHDVRPDMPAELRVAPASPLAKRVEAMRAEAAKRKQGANLG